MRGQNRGFTFLEAIIALTILAAVLIPFYSFVGNSFKSLMKTSDKIEKIAATEHAVTFLKSINPTEEPQGTMDFGLFNIEYQSQELLPAVPAFVQAPVPTEDTQGNKNPLPGPVPKPRPQSLALPNQKPADITLYATHVRVNKKGASWFEFDVRQIGYKAPPKSILIDGNAALNADGSVSADEPPPSALPKAPGAGGAL